MNFDQITAMEKVANDLLSAGDNMNPDPMPAPTDDELAEIQAENAMLAEQLEQEQQTEQMLNEEEMQAQQAVQNGDMPQGENVDAPLSPEEEQALLAEEQVASLISEELIKHANEMYELGTLAKIIESARGENGPELQKSAHYVLSYMTENAEQYYPGLEKIANELFPTDEAAAPLFTLDALYFIEEQLAFLEDDALEKVANETGGLFTNLKVMAGSAIENAKNKVIDAAKSVTELREIGGQIGQAEAELTATREALNNGLVPDAAIPNVLQQREQLVDSLQHLQKRQLTGRAIAGAGAGALAGAAAYGGHQLYQHLNQPNQDEMLSQEKLSGTLETEYVKNGGFNQMNKQYVQDMLKIAGAAGLVSIANNEQADFGLRKEASETLEQIARLGRSEMNESLVKVATEIYQEQELHEIVAGHHTEALMSKVAYFLQANEASIDELEKTANAGGVAAAKNIGAGLADAASNIENTIASEKAQTEGAGREYIGDVANGSGKAGGGLVGGTEGYNVINNPQKYDIEQTAAILEEAHLAKQAAAEAFVNADNVIKSIISGK